MNTPVAIVDGFRTPFVKAGADFSFVSAQELGRVVTAELLARSQVDPNHVDEVIFGNVAHPMDAANISRVIALQAGLPLNISAQTVSRNCASGMQSIATAVDMIQAKRSNIIIAGGTESMSNIPLVFPKSMSLFLEKLARSKSPIAKLKTLSTFKLSYLQPIIALLQGLKDPFCGLSMGQTAQILANEFGISREQQDFFALGSHQKTSAAMESGRFDLEVVPLFASQLKKIIHRDIGPRANQTIQALEKLPPYFDRKHGSVTVGNSCPITDGASALLLMSEEKVREYNITPIAWIRSYAFAGLDPKRMGLGPAVATPLALKSISKKLSDMDLIEINEAFAAQVLSVLKVFKTPAIAKHIGIPSPETLSEVDPAIVNVNGGAVALGHPVGTSGNRIVLTLSKELHLRNKQWGLASICIGGGQGGAMVLERN
ncbi:MAG: thiolase family protein [Deltaproteobacteria bacterium]|nr:thiolase family protein [Deltaproteobacteria bacterium]